MQVIYPQLLPAGRYGMLRTMPVNEERVYKAMIRHFIQHGSLPTKLVLAEKLSTSRQRIALLIDRLVYQGKLPTTVEKNARGNQYRYDYRRLVFQYLTEIKEYLAE